MKNVIIKTMLLTAITVSSIDTHCFGRSLVAMGRATAKKAATQTVEKTSFARLRKPARPQDNKIAEAIEKLRQDTKIVDEIRNVNESIRWVSGATFLLSVAVTTQLAILNLNMTKRK